MKRFTSFLLLLFFSLSIFSQTKFKCPATGLDKNAKKPSARISTLNKLKNRNNVPAQTSQNVTLDDILANGNDTNRFKNDQGVTITGFIFGVKAGGAEDCNCFNGKEEFIDTHIEIALSAKEKSKRNVIVVEMTPRFKAKHPEWRTSEIKKLVGKKVTITGWLFFDGNHVQNSRNTRPKGTNIYRATAWEIHPVINFDVID
jgi:hypothetical protein